MFDKQCRPVLPGLKVELELEGSYFAGQSSQLTHVVQFHNHSTDVYFPVISSLSLFSIISLTFPRRFALSDCGKQSIRKHSKHWQRPPCLYNVLADFQHNGSSILWWQIFQMC